MRVLQMDGQGFSDENESKRDVIWAIFNYTKFESLLNSAE